MQLILDKYHENESSYPLPVIRKRTYSERSVYCNVSYNINHHFKQAATMLKLNLRLKMYVACYS